jgi:hypothetical protein
MAVPENTRQTSLVVALARIFWMMIGPLALAVLALNVASKGGGWLTGVDVAYLAVLGLVLAARWLEFRSGQGQTATGEPMTGADFRRYLVTAAGVGLAVWAVANLAGNHWPAR